MMEQKNPIQLMMEGYAKIEKEQLKEGKTTEAEKEGDVTNFQGEKQKRTLSPLEKMMKSYTPEGKQKEEVSVNPNDIKEG